MASVLETKSVNDALKSRRTAGMGDCAFHATLGKWNGTQFVYGGTLEARKKIAEAVRNCKPSDPIYKSLCEAIQHIIMSERRGGERINALRLKYQSYLKDNETSVNQAWHNFQRKLENYEDVMAYINKNTAAYIGKEDLRNRFNRCLNINHGELYGIILSLEDLQQSFTEYNQQSNASFDLDKFIDQKTIEEYAELIGTIGYWLLPSELKILAYAFNISVEYYIKDKKKDQDRRIEIYNPGGSKPVKVFFNGVNHYERMAIDEECAMQEEQYKNIYGSPFLFSPKIFGAVESAPKKSVGDMSTEPVVKINEKKIQELPRITKSSVVTNGDVKNILEVSKKICLELSKGRAAAMLQIDEEITKTKQRIVEINSRLNIDPVKLRDELEAKKQSLEQSRLKLLEKKEALDVQIAVNEKSLIENLSRSTATLSMSAEGGEYLEAAIDKFINKGDLLQHQEKGLLAAKENKKPHESLMVRTLIRQQELDKSTFNQNLRAAKEKRNGLEAEIAAKKQKLSEIQEKIDAIKPTLQKASEAKTAAEDSLDKLQQELTKLKAERDKFISDYDKDKSQLEAQKTSEPQRLDKECAQKIAELDAACAADVAGCNGRKVPLIAKRNRLNQLNAEQTQILARMRQIGDYNNDEWKRIRSTYINQLTEWNNLRFQKPPFDTLIASIDAEIAGVENDYAGRRRNKNQEYETLKAQKLKEISDKITKNREEYDPKFEKYKSDIEKLEESVKTAKQTVVDAQKDVANAEEIYKKEQKPYELLDAEIKDRIESCSHVDTMIASYTQLIALSDIRLEKLNAQIKHTSSESSKESIKQEPDKQESTIIPEAHSTVTETHGIIPETHIDLSAVTQKLDTQRDERIKLKISIEECTSEITDLNERLANLLTVLEHEKIALKKARSQKQTDLQQLELEQRSITEYYNELLQASLMAENIAIAGFRKSENRNSVQLFVACLLQALFNKYAIYNLNGEANSEPPVVWLQTINSIIEKSHVSEINLENIPKLIAAINAEFADDKVSLNVKLITVDGKELVISNTTGSEVVILVHNEKDYTLLQGAYAVLPNKYLHLHRIMTGFGIAGTEEVLCYERLQCDIREDWENALESELTKYYQTEEAELNKLEDFDALIARILTNHQNFKLGNSSLAIKSLLTAANLASDKEISKSDVKDLVQHFVKQYLSTLRNIINKEILRREKLDDVLASTREERISKLERQLEAKNNEAQKLLLLINEKKQKITEMTLDLEKKQANTEKLRKSYEEQQQTLNTDLNVVRAKKKKCDEELEAIEATIHLKEEERIKLKETAIDLAAQEQTLLASLERVEEVWKEARNEVSKLECALNNEKAELSKLEIELDKSERDKKEASDEVSQLKLFLELIGTIHDVVRNDRDLFTKRETLRQAIFELKADFKKTIPEKAAALYKLLISFDGLAKNLSVEKQALINKELLELNDAEVLDQMYGVVLDLISAPNIKWDRQARRYSITGCNLSWIEVSQAIENAMKQEIAKYGLGFENGKLVVKDLSLMGKISDLPTEIRTLIEERIEVKTFGLQIDAAKNSWGKGAQEHIARLEIDYYDLLKAYVDHIEIIAGNNLEIEPSIKEIKFPGICLNILTQGTLYAPEGLLLDTSGRDAPEYIHKQAPSGSEVANGKAPDGRRGRDGLDGLPGSTAGSIFIRSETLITNLATISCRTNGGAGSTGQQGGDGEQGRKGKGTPDAKAEDTNGVGRAQWRLAKARIPGIGINGEEIPEEISGNGGPGGFGGLGGVGGFAGEITITDPNNEISRTEKEGLKIKGDIADKIKPSQYEAINGKPAQAKARRGKGGPAGEAGEVGLDELVIKESFWKKTRKSHGYYDESVFKKYEEYLNRGWGHDFFGTRAFIDRGSSDYRIQYKLYGDWLNPPFNGDRRLQSSDLRSRGEKGEDNEQEGKDETNRKKAVVHTNYAKDRSYFANMRQTAISLSQSKEWKNCQIRSQKYITRAEQKKIQAEANIAQCDAKKALTSQSVNALQQKSDGSKSRAALLESEYTSIRTDLKNVKQGIQINDSQQYKNAAELAQLQSQAIELRAAVSCAEIDVSSQNTIAANLEQSYRMLVAAAKVNESFYRQRIAEVRDSLDSLTTELATVRNAQEHMQSELQSLLVEKEASSKLEQHKTLERSKREANQQDSIQIQYMLKLDPKKAFASQKQSDYSVSQTIKTETAEDIPKKHKGASPTFFNKIKSAWASYTQSIQDAAKYRRFGKHFINFGLPSLIWGKPSITIKSDATLRLQTSASLLAPQDISQEIEKLANKHNINKYSIQYQQFKKLITEAFTNRDYLKTNFLQYLQTIDDYEALVNMLNILKSIEPPKGKDINYQKIFSVFQKFGFYDKCFQLKSDEEIIDFGCFLMAMKVATSMQSEDVNVITKYALELKQAIARIKGLELDTEFESKLLFIFLPQLFKLLSLIYKEEFYSIKANQSIDAKLKVEKYTAKIKELINMGSDLYGKDCHGKIQQFINSIIKQTTIDSNDWLNILAYVKEVYVESFEIIAVCASKTVNVLELDPRQSLNYINLVTTTNDYRPEDKPMLLQSILGKYINECYQCILKLPEKYANKRTLQTITESFVGFSKILLASECPFSFEQKFELLSKIRTKIMSNLDVSKAVDSASLYTFIQTTKDKLLEECKLIFAKSISLKEEVELGFLSLLAQDLNMLKYVPQYLFLLNTMQSEHPEKFDLKMCQQLEGCLLDIKHIVFKSTKSEHQEQLTQFIIELETILENAYLEIVKEAFTKQLQSLEEIHVKFNNIDEQTQKFESFYHVSDPISSKNKKQFVKLLLAKLMAYSVSDECDSIDELIKAVNNAAFKYLKGANLFTAQYPDSIQKQIDEIKRMIDSSDLNLINRWLALQKDVMSALQSTESNLWVKEFLLDSCTLLQQLLVNDKECSEQLAKVAESVKNIAINLESKTVDTELRNALDQLHLDLELAAYIEHDYFYMPQAWQRFIKKNPIINNKNYLQDIFKTTQLELNKFFYAFKTMNQPMSKIGPIIDEIVVNVKAGNSAKIKHFLQSKHEEIFDLCVYGKNTEDQLNGALTRVRKLLAEVVDTKDQSECELLLKKIFLQILHKNTLIPSNQFAETILELFKIRDQLSIVSNRYLSMVVKLVVESYTNRLSQQLSKTNGAVDFIDRLNRAILICNRQQSWDIMLSIYVAIETPLKSKTEISINDVNTALDNAILKSLASSGINDVITTDLFKIYSENNNLLALLALLSDKYLPLKKIKEMSRQLSIISPRLKPKSIVPFVLFAHTILQRHCRNLVQIYGAGSHNGQSIERIACYIDQLLSEITLLCDKLGEKREKDDLMALYIQKNVALLQNISGFLDYEYKKDTLLNNFIVFLEKQMGHSPSIEELQYLLQGDEKLYLKYVTKELLIDKQILPTNWADALRRKCNETMNDILLRDLKQYTDTDHDSYKAIASLFSESTFDYLVENQELANLRKYLQQLITSDVKDVDGIRRAYQEVNNIIDTYLVSHSPSTLLNELKRLLNDSLMCKELLAISEIIAKSKGQQEEWLFCLDLTTKRQKQKIDLEEVNLILSALQSFSNLSRAKAILLLNDGDDVCHKLLLTLLEESISESHYTEQEQDKIREYLVDFKRNIYNTKLGCKFLYLIVSLFKSKESKSLSDKLQLLDLMIDLKVYENPELIAELDSGAYAFWQAILIRAKWQKLLFDAGVKEKCPEIIDNLIAIEKSIGSRLILTLIEKLKNQPEKTIQLDQLQAIIKCYFSGEWDLDQEAIELLNDLPFHIWTETLVKYYQNKKLLEGKLEQRSIEMLIDIMRSDDSGINKSVSDIYDKLKDQINNIKIFYEKNYAGLSKEQQVKAILEIAGICKQQGMAFYRDDNNIIRFIAAMNAALYLAKGFCLRNAQMLAILCFIKGFNTGRGRLGEIYTSEGKTLITAFVAIALAVSGDKVDIITSSSELAKRDADECKPIFELFGLKASNNCDGECEQNETVRTERYHDAQIMYGEIGAFQRDYLLSNYMQKNIRNKLAQNLILDEADSMCIDNAERTLYISHRIEDLAYLKDLFVLIWAMISQSSELGPYTENNVNKVIELVQEQRKKNLLKIPSVLNEFVNRRLKIWVNSAYCAKFMVPGHQYCIPEDGVNAGEAIIMDLYTGVAQINTQWSNGLHQFIQLKHSCRLTDESLKAIFISNMNFLRKYGGRLYGMSGTLGSQTELDLLANTYGLDSFRIPRYRKERYKQEDGIVVADKPSESGELVPDRLQWLDHIAMDVTEKLSTTRVITAEEHNSAKEGLKKCTKKLFKCLALLLLKHRNYKTITIDIATLQKEQAKISHDLQDEKCPAETRKVLLQEKSVLELKIKRATIHLSKTKQCIQDTQKLIKEEKEVFRNHKNILISNTKRAVLIICEDQNAVKAIEKRLKASELPKPHNIMIYDTNLNGFKVGCLHPGDIVIATNIAGRGTDFKTSKMLEENGGLHVLLSYMAPNIRVETQAFRRTARAGNRGTGKFIVYDARANRYPISIEYLRDERDAKESARLAEFSLQRKPKIDFEDFLFIKFAELQEEIKNKLIARNEKPAIITLQIKSLQDHWAFFLDSQSDNIEKVHLEGRDKVLNAYSIFVKQMHADLTSKKYGLISEPGEILKLAKYYLDDEKYSEAELCYDEILTIEKDLSGFAHYYKALCIFGNEAGFDRKKEARTHLKLAVKYFTDAMSRLSTSSQVIKAISEKRLNLGVGGDVDHFTVTNAHEISFLNIHLQAANEALGTELMPKNLVSGYFTAEDSVKLWQNIRTQCTTIVKDYRVSKKIKIIEGELYYKDNKIDFPSQLEYCKKEIIAKLSKKVALDYEQRKLPVDLFHDLILTKKEFLETSASVLSQQPTIEVLPNAANSVTGLSVWLARSEIKKFILALELPLAEVDLANKFNLTATELKTLLDGLEATKIIKRSSQLIMTMDASKKIENIIQSKVQSNKLPDNFLELLGIQLTPEKLIHAKAYTKLIMQVYFSNKENTSVELDLPEDKQEKSKVILTQLRDLSIVKFPTVKFPLTRDPEKRLDEIKETLKGRLKDLLRSIDDKDEREKMEDDLYDLIEKSIGKIKTIPKLKIDKRNLQFYFKEGKIPPEIMDFMVRCCDEVLSLKKDSGWWDWDAFLVAIIGLVQLAAGVILSAIGFSFIGQVLISEGISDMTFAIQSMAAGNFSWKAYGEHKWQSLLISVACAGIGAAIPSGAGNGTAIAGKFSESFVREAIVKKIIAKCIETAISCGITIAAGALSKEIAKMVLDQIKRTIKSEIRSSATFIAAAERLKAKMEHLYSHLKVDDADRAIATALRELNLEQKIKNQFATQALKIADRVSGQLSKLAASDKFAGTKFGNSTLAAFGAISSILSEVLRVANIAKVCAEISSNTGTLLEEFEKRLDAIDKRTASQQIKQNIEDERVKKLAADQLEKTIDAITTQVQLYFENHLITEGITQVAQLASKPTLNELVGKLSADMNSLETAIANEDMLMKVGRGEIQATAQDKLMLMSRINHTGVSSVHTLSDMTQQDPQAKIVTENGEVDLRTVIEQRGGHGVYVVHRNDKFFLIQPDYTQYLDNVRDGKYTGAFDLTLFAQHSHRTIQVLEVSGESLVPHKGGPQEGFKPIFGATDQKPIQLMLSGKHYQPVINGEIVELPFVEGMPESSCAAQSIVFVNAYEKAIKDHRSTSDAYSFAMREAQNSGNIRQYLQSTVTDALGNSDIRDSYYGGVQQKYPAISGGEIGAFPYDQSSLMDFGNRLLQNTVDGFNWWQKNHMTLRAFNAINCVGGTIAGAAALGVGGATSEFGVGVPAVLAGTMMLDGAYASCKSLIFGGSQPTYLNLGLRGVGLDQQQADYWEAGLNFGITFTPAFLKYRLTDKIQEFNSSAALEARLLDVQEKLAMDAEATLLGTNTRTFRANAQKVIQEDPNHLLRFLLDTKDQFHKPTSRTHYTLYEHPEWIEMGHILSDKYGGPERIMLQNAWENRFNGITIEKPRLGAFVENAAIYIESPGSIPIPVSLRTAIEWENLNLIPKGTVENARRVVISPTLR